jgi:hypothetical protein
MYFADGLNEQLRGHVLEDHALRAETDGLEELIVIDHRRQQDDARAAILVTQRAQQVESAASRHQQIEHEYVRRCSAYRAERLIGISAPRHDVDIGLQSEELLEAVEHEGVIIGQRDADARVRLRRRWGE